MTARENHEEITSPDQDHELWDWFPIQSELWNRKI
jgi:hypothetical protein